MNITNRLKWRYTTKQMTGEIVPLKDVARLIEIIDKWFIKFKFSTVVLIGYSLGCTDITH